MYNLSDTEFSFDIQDQDETELVMHLFGEYLCTEMEEERANLVRRIGFDSGPNSFRIGKSTAINAMVQTFGDREIYEIAKPNYRHQQQLMYSDRVGWVRHYDSHYKSATDFNIPSCEDDEIWEHKGADNESPDLAVGLDIIEHPYLDIPEHPYSSNNLNYDFIIKMKKQDDTIRSISFAAKQEYIDDPYFMDFINGIQPALERDRAAKAESHAQFNPT